MGSSFWLSLGFNAAEYAHLNLRYDGHSFDIHSPVVPAKSVGLYATRNRDGWEIKRTDLPKITKTFSWETPNFGDASTYGTHTHFQDREVYQKQVFEPRMFGISVELMNSPGTDTALVKFQVEQPLDKNSETFSDDLLFCLNLLQESTGVSDVYSSEANRDDFIGTVLLDWEVFPPGNGKELLAAMSKGRNPMTPDKAKVAEERLEVFDRLPVEHLIRGTGSFGNYIGALYSDDLVVFENLNYGNALYVLFADWREISKRSRLQLLRGTTEHFDRIIHTDGWEDRFQTLVEMELQKRGRHVKKRRA